MSVALSAPSLPGDASLNPADADVGLASRGDRRAFGRLVDRHRRVVASIALAVTRDVALADEIAQEVFITAWRKLPRLHSPASLGAWLGSLARNRAIDEVRRRRRLPASDPAAVDAAVDPDAGALDALVRAEDSRRIAAAMETLDDESREALVLFYREGRSIAQVASDLGIREDAAKKRLSRGRERLRDEMEASLEESLRRTEPPASFTAAVLAGLDGAGPQLVPRPRMGRVASVSASVAAVALLGVVAVFGPHSFARPGRSLPRAASPAIASSARKSLEPDRNPSNAGGAARWLPERHDPSASGGGDGKSAAAAGSMPFSTAALIDPARPRAPIAGHISFNNKPAAGVTITLVGCEPADAAGEKHTFVSGEKPASTVSAGDGSFQLDAPDNSRCIVAATDPVRGKTTAFALGGDDSLALEIASGGEVRGVLLGPDGSPRDVGGHATAWRKDDDDTLLGEEQQSLEGGTFDFRNLAAGHWTIRVTLFDAPWPDTQEVDVDVGSATDLVMHVPAEGVLVRGRAVLPDGSPGSFAKIYFQDGAVTFDSTLTAGADGRFEIPNVRGDATFDFVMPDYQGRISLTGLTTGTRDVGDVVLAPHAPVVGQD